MLSLMPLNADFSKSTAIYHDEKEHDCFQLNMFTLARLQNLQQFCTASAITTTHEVVLSKVCLPDSLCAYQIVFMIVLVNLEKDHTALHALLTSLMVPCIH